MSDVSTVIVEISPPVEVLSPVVVITIVVPRTIVVVPVPVVKILAIIANITIVLITAIEILPVISIIVVSIAVMEISRIVSIITVILVTIIILLHIVIAVLIVPSCEIILTIVATSIRPVILVFSRSIVIYLRANHRMVIILMWPDSLYTAFKLCKVFYKILFNSAFYGARCVEVQEKLEAIVFMSRCPFGGLS